MTLGHWVLDEKKNVIPATLLQWAEWFEKASRDGSRIVKQEWIGDCWVSTVFLGLDHNYSERGPPILWESMIFSNRAVPHDQIRCSGTWEQAEAMHEDMVRKACEIEKMSVEEARNQQIKKERKNE